MSDELVKALEWIAEDAPNYLRRYGALYPKPASEMQAVALKALAAHKAKPALSEEEIQRIIAKSYYNCIQGHWMDWEQLEPNDIMVETCLVYAKAVLKALRDAGVLNVRGRD